MEGSVGGSCISCCIDLGYDGSNESDIFLKFFNFLLKIFKDVP